MLLPNQKPPKDSSRPHFEIVLKELDLLSILQEFHPYVIGTPPLGLEIPSSDIDVACSAADLQKFGEFVSSRFGDQAGFQCHSMTVREQQALVASFSYRDWAVELFCQSTPIELQFGVRHFLIERRLLSIEPRLKAVVLELKNAGMKTEPAFVTALGLLGDAYDAMLALESFTDAELARLAASSIHSWYLFSSASEGTNPA